MLLVASVEPFAVWHHRRTRGAAETPEAAPLAAVDEGGVVRGADPAARAAGVRSGMSLAGARGHVPALRTVPAWSADLEAAWAALHEEAYAFSPALRAVRPGVLAFEGGPADAEQFGRAFEARVGGAPSLEEAHLLAYLAPPGAARCHHEPWARLDRAPVFLLRGVGLPRDDVARLAWLGVERIGPLRAWSARQLEAFLGAGGRAVRPYLLGPRTTALPRHAPPAAVRVRLAFPEPAREPQRLEPALARLAEHASRRLGDRSAGRVTMIAEAGGVRSRATRVAKAPARRAEALGRYAAHALDDTGLAPLGLDVLELVLTDVRRPSMQGELWTSRRRAHLAARFVQARYPGRALRYRLADPYALRPERRYQLVDAVGGAPAATADAAPAADAPRSAATTTEEAADARRDRARDPVPG